MPPTSEIAVIRRVLDREAKALSEGRAIPLDVTELANEIGVDVVPAEGGAHGLLRHDGVTWRVVVNTSTSPLRQRFTIAHELAHYLVEATVSFRPTTTSDYWRLESECQAFAAALIAPEWVVRDCLGNATSDPSALLDAARELATRAQISIEGAARRIIEVTRRPMAIALIGLDVRPSGRRTGWISWLHSEHAWADAGRGRKIGAGHVLWPALVAAHDASIGDSRFIDVPAASAAVVRRESPDSSLFAAVP